MSNVTGPMVKDLRDKTGAGMMDCKSALAETDGDVEAAIDWLRKKGLSKAAKKSSRVAAEGLIGVAVNGDAGALVEVNAETDFVARNDTFKEFVKRAADLALLAGGDVDKLLAHPHTPGGASVRETATDCVVEPDRTAAIELAIRAARVGDIVLLAGKGHEKVQILKDGTVPFDDVAVAAEVLKELA